MFAVHSASLRLAGAALRPVTDTMVEQEALLGEGAPGRGSATGHMAHLAVEGQAQLVSASIPGAQAHRNGVQLRSRIDEMSERICRHPGQASCAGEQKPGLDRLYTYAGSLEWQSKRAVPVVTTSISIDDRGAELGAIWNASDAMWGPQRGGGWSEHDASGKVLLLPGCVCSSEALQDSLAFNIPDKACDLVPDCPDFMLGRNVLGTSKRPVLSLGGSSSFRCQCRALGRLPRRDLYALTERVLQPQHHKGGGALKQRRYSAYPFRCASHKLSPARYSLRAAPALERCTNSRLLQPRPADLSCCR